MSYSDGTNGVRARNVRIKMVEAATSAALEIAVQAFLAGLSEEVLLSVQYNLASSSLFTAMILFTR